MSEQLQAQLPSRALVLDVLESALNHGELLHRKLSFPSSAKRLPLLFTVPLVSEIDVFQLRPRGGILRAHAGRESELTVETLQVIDTRAVV
ncbi:hypothetical protein [Corynebacterium sp. Marseille-P4321]|uniref:hypothetical protein n=1 Tax=Corynebacterium sp. Marseille-P4321 TaxID=2736603 RepID=UPI0020CA9C2E|nr:hypothetical protein [Corynebacterium sp. Marseille-P4321]